MCKVLLPYVGLLILVPIARLLLLILPLTIVVELPLIVLCSFLWAVVGKVTCLTTVKASLNRSVRGTRLHLRAKRCALTVLGGVVALNHLVGMLVLILTLVGALKPILILPLLHPSTLLLWSLWHGQSRTGVTA